ncbi:EMILIN-3-like [Cyprinodon tularosa]|uniref:EMILIN-3-like n=1 Tax=Cyprinodon tularosa TaxID=77115 RepID=UPI0018E22B02|nr:EMILIN-3-like [Cyprinodon tularosa]
MHFAVLIGLFLPLAEAKYHNSFPVHQELGTYQEQMKPTSKHSNHCAYVVEKLVSFTVQDGAAPYVKAEYNKCSWAKKCPTLLYRLLYKPMYKVAHKTVTELEWRCCPGFSGYNCMEVQQIYQHPMKMMPPFNGQQTKGPQFRGPQHQGPMFKGPMFNGPPLNPAVKPKPWNQPKQPSINSFSPYPLPHFGSSKSSFYPDTSFEPYPAETQPDPEYQEEHRTDNDQEHEEEYSQRPEDVTPGEVPAPAPPPSGEEHPEEKITGQALDSETEERIFRIEEDIRHVSHGLETLRGTVSGLEASLRASLREDANRMLSALLSAAPSPLVAPATASNPPTIGFVEIPARDPEIEGSDDSHVFTALSEKVEELKRELQVKAAELQELTATVQGHDGVLKIISNGAELPTNITGNSRGDAESLMDAKLQEVKVEILDGFKKRVESAEERCKEKVGDERRQCQRNPRKQQEQTRDALEESTSKLRTEMGIIQSQIHSFSGTEGCCSSISGLAERVQHLETSVASLNQSQGLLRVDLSGHRDHIEGMLEGRLGYVEAKLNLTGQIKNDGPEMKIAGSYDGVTGMDLESRMEGKLRDLEGRLLTALEELSNATAPALLEGHAVPTLETELESLRGRLELDVDRVQKHLNDLELLCSTSCSSSKTSATQGDSAEPSENQKLQQNVKQVLDLQDDRLTSLNFTLQKILENMALMERQIEAESVPPFQAELTVLKFNVRSVNHTLMSLQDSLGTVVHQVGEANSSWHEREVRLAKQMKGVVQLVGHQASMLGASERRLTRLKGELLEMKRRLAEEVRGCQSTAMVVKQEVTEVGGLVASVEDQCKGLNDLADDLERIREELEKQSNTLLLQVNGTLSSHAQQLYELKDELRNCTSRAEPTKSLEMATPAKRGDTFTQK